jgi:L-ribulokinase
VTNQHAPAFGQRENVEVNRNVFTPNEEDAAAYDRLYAEYRELHDYRGRGGNAVMHRLRQLKREALA